MRKVLIIIAVFFVLVFGAQSIHAVDNDYKNSLLKIEVSELDATHYNIGLYTQKIYNEPVKIIQKSDTIYYFLLPETSHAITSVAPVGAVKNVLVKTYPYSGQDMNNGYTKVAIITTKPVNLTTSLRTLDATVSPRLDPARLARLDNVFARYSERLVQNNIQSPLNEFRKTTVAQRPAIKSNVNVDTEKVASSKTNAKSFEEYQNKSNKEQAAAKSTSAKTATTSVTQKAVQTTKPQAQTSTKTATSVNKQAQAPVKQQVPVTQKVAQAVKPAVKQATQAKPQTQTSTKTAAPVKTAASVNKQAQAPVKQQVPVTQKVAQAVQSAPKATQAAKPQAQAPAKTTTAPAKEQAKASAPVKQQAPVTQKVASAPQPVVPAAKQAAPAKAPAVKDVEKQASPIAQQPAKTEAPSKQQEPLKEVKAPVQAETKQLSAEDKKAIEYEKQLQIKEPVEATFKDENGNVAEKQPEPEKEVTAEVPDAQAQQQEEQQPEQQAPDNTSAYMLLGSAFVMFIMYMYIKKSKKKQAQFAANVPDGVPEARDVKELLRKTAEKSREIREQNEVQNTEQAYYADETAQEVENETVEQDETVLAQNPLINDLYYEGDEQTQSDYLSEEDLQAENTEEADIEAEEEQTEEEKIEAFNSYMDSITPDDEKLPLEISPETPDDTLIEQLYTPISSSLYKEDDEQAEYANDEIGVEEASADSNNDDVATIVSSSKLTETRGLYLAKFEGSTSLVGYIQDDIYVLYNFGEEEIKDTEIESSLAQENETDSLYIVKTGGKKLIVKSTPYDMSLEMEM